MYKRGSMPNTTSHKHPLLKMLKIAIKVKSLKTLTNPIKVDSFKKLIYLFVFIIVNRIIRNCYWVWLFYGVFYSGYG